jgi:hypothetical protein
MFDLYNYSLPTIFLIGVAVILAAIEIGRLLGVRTVGRNGDNASAPEDDNVSTLESAVLGLLALMIAFTFAMALSRFEARRDAVLNEANTISTTALRARLLPEPHRAEALKMLQEYVQIRLDITQRPVSPAELTVAVDRSNTLQEALWQQAQAMAAKDNGMVPTGLFIQTLNEMIDSQGKRLAVFRNRVPNVVLLALFAVAAIAHAFAGYVSGRAARGGRLPIYITGFLVSAVILMILDLDRPSAGFIEVSQRPMIDAAASIAAFPK